MSIRDFAIGTLSIAVMGPLGLSQEVTQGTLLERVRDAIGEPTDGVVLLEGEAGMFGVEGSFSGAFDGDGRFLTTIDSPFGMRSGFDGKTAWDVDWNGTPRELVLSDVDLALLQSWAASGHWAFAEDTIEIVDGPTSDMPTLELTLSEGKLQATVEVDPQSWLPSRMIIEHSTGDQTIDLSGYEPFGTMMLPTRVESNTPGGENIWFEMHEFASAAATDVQFAPKLARPTDIRFDPEVGADLEVKRVPSGHLLVHPLVNGEDVGWFIFDTGAGANVLSTPIGEELGIEAQGNIMAQGVGGFVEAGFFRVSELTLGPVTLSDQAFIGIDLAFLEGFFGVPIAGIVGHDLLTRCVVEFDGQGAEIALHDPRTYERHENARWEALHVVSRMPVVMAAFEGREAPFRLDTGAAGSIAFHAPAVQEFAMLEGRQTTESTSDGVGGGVPMLIGAVSTFTLAGRVYEDLQVGFAIERVGAFADAYTAGNIGGEVLNEFRLVFDYQNGRIGFIERED